MNFSSRTVEEAVEKIAGLPGIGKKTALRLVLFLLRDSFGFREELVESISRLSQVRFCRQCHNLADEDLCGICQSAKRNESIICVVESVRDIMAIEETGHFNGHYHVLGGVISPLDGVGPDQLHISSLMRRIEEGDIKEIIMAISPTIDGDTTIYYISKLIPPQIRISTIARGVSFGGELEYADELTLGRSISGRVPYHNDLDS